MANYLPDTWSVFRSDGNLSYVKSGDLISWGYKASDLRLANPHLPPSQTAILFQKTETNKYVVACTDIASCLISESCLVMLSDDQSLLFREEFQRRHEHSESLFLDLCLEVLLDLMQYKLSEALDALLTESYPTLEQLGSKVTSDGIVMLRSLKNQVAQLSVSLESYKDMLSQGLAEEGPDNEIEVLTTVLQPFYIRAAGLHSKLRTVADSITDEEDLLTLKLDAQRNQLIVVTLLLTCASLALSVIAAVSGLFGMNLENAIWGPDNTKRYFDWVCASSVILAIITFVGVTWYCRHAQLI